MPLSSGKHRDEETFIQLLDTNGDGTGDKNAILNYSDAGLGSTDFFFQPPAGEVWLVSQLRIHLCSAGLFPQHGYGAIASPGLTNGLKMELKTGVAPISIRSVIGGIVVRDNDEWLHTGGEMQLIEYQGVDNSMIITYDLQRQFGGVLVVDSDQDQRIVVNCHDDMTALADHHFIIAGIK